MHTKLAFMYDYQKKDWNTHDHMNFKVPLPNSTGNLSLRVNRFLYGGGLADRGKFYPINRFLKTRFLVVGFYCILHVFVGWPANSNFFVFVFVFYFSSHGWYTYCPHIAAKTQTGYIESSCCSVGWWPVLSRLLVLKEKCCLSLCHVQVLLLYKKHE